MLARFPRRSSLTLIAAVALVIAIANPATAPPGDLDPTFDGDGKVTTDFAGGSDQGAAVAIQGDGKIVVTGTDLGVFDFALARYNADGSLDPTFDADGRVTTDFGSNDQAFAVAIQGDGKIVTAGTAIVSSFDFALARYNPDGSLDPTFDADGKVTTDFVATPVTDDAAFAVAIQSDGKIVAAGFAAVPDGGHFALARYNPDGSLDPSFDGDGRVITDFFGDLDQALAVAIQGDGKIVAVGQSFTSTGTVDFAVARYNPDGSLDPSFGGGRVTTDFAGAGDQAFGTAIQGDGRIVAAGFASVSGTRDFAVARYNPDASLDLTLDGDGKVTTDFAGAGDQAFGTAIQGDGKIVTAGVAAISGAEDFALARYNTDGSLDTIFGGDGKVTTDFAGGGDRAQGVAIQVDRKIVAAGSAAVSGTDDFALARYTVCRRTSRPSSIPFCP